MSNVVDIKTIAATLEALLNAPFPRGVEPKSFDTFTASDLYGIAQKVCLHTDLVEQFAKECREAVESYFTAGTHSRGGLRISKLGSEPILQAFNIIGVPIAGDDFDNLWIGLAGHFYEAWVRFVLRARGFTVHGGDYNQCEVDFDGVKGHYDFILETKLGRRIVVEVKHVSATYLDTVLESERVENPATGNMVKTGNNLSELSSSAVGSDTRGYLTQLALYRQCTGHEGLFIFWDKSRNRTHVVPMHDGLKNYLVNEVTHLLPTLRALDTIEDVLDSFEIPVPFAQRKAGKDTGLFYVPFTMRYINPVLKDALYTTFIDDAGKEVCTGVRTKDEILLKLSGVRVRHRHRKPTVAV